MFQENNKRIKYLNHVPSSWRMCHWVPLVPAQARICKFKTSSAPTNPLKLRELFLGRCLFPNRILIEP